MIRKVIPLVNRMLDLTPEVFNTLRRYHVPAGLPAWLGGIDHPEGLLEDFVMDDVTKKVLSYLEDASLDILVEEYLVKSFDSFATDNAPLLTITTSFLTLQESTRIEDMTTGTYIARASICLPERETGEKWGLYTARLESFIKSLGLVSIKKILDDYTSATAIRDAYQNPEWESDRVPVGRRIRARRKHLRSILPDDYEPVQGRVLTPWSVKKGIERKLGNRFVLDEFLDEIGLLRLPSFQVKGT